MAIASSEAESAAVARMRAAGLRRMPGRMLVLRSLATSPTHLSAADIHRGRGAAYESVALGTVHRALDALRHAGIVHVVDEAGTARYGIAAPPHLHAICTSCGRLAEVNVAGLEHEVAALGERAGLVVHIDGVQLRGVCEDCAAHR